VEVDSQRLLLQARRITKSFPGVKALAGVDYGQNPEESRRFGIPAGTPMAVAAE
jgi:hypothetical protein